MFKYQDFSIKKKILIIDKKWKTEELSRLFKLNFENIPQSYGIIWLENLYQMTMEGSKPDKLTGCYQASTMNTNRTTLLSNACREGNQVFKKTSNP